MSHLPQLQGRHPHQLFCGNIERIPKEPATELVQKIYSYRACIGRKNNAHWNSHTLQDLHKYRLKISIRTCTLVVSSGSRGSNITFWFLWYFTESLILMIFYRKIGSAPRIIKLFSNFFGVLAAWFFTPYIWCGTVLTCAIISSRTRRHTYVQLCSVHAYCAYRSRMV